MIKGRSGPRLAASRLVRSAKIRAYEEGWWPEVLGDAAEPNVNASERDAGGIREVKAAARTVELL